MQKPIWHLVLTAAILGIAATVVAQPTHHVAASKVLIGPWTMHPVYATESGASASVVGFLALSDPSAAVGNNLIAVWYKRDDTGWTAKTWLSCSAWEAVMSVKLEMGIADSEDGNWDMAGSSGIILNPPAQEEYQLGVLADDPLAGLLDSSPDRDAIIEALVFAGYPAADIPVDKTEGPGCTRDAKLTALAEAVVETLIGEPQTISERVAGALQASQASGCPSLAAVAVPLPPIQPPTQISPWTPITNPWKCETYINPPPIDTNLPFENCRRERWTDAALVVESRLVVCVRPGETPSFSIVVQQRLCTRLKHIECTTCTPSGSPPPTPCLPAGTNPPRPSAPIPAGCIEWHDPIMDCNSWTPMNPCS